MPQIVRWHMQFPSLFSSKALPLILVSIFLSLLTICVTIKLSFTLLRIRSPMNIPNILRLCHFHGTRSSFVSPSLSQLVEMLIRSLSQPIYSLSFQVGRAWLDIRSCLGACCRV
ncbi:uncharacterized protein M6B38_322190 [Iris pallida]|uniref:Uncharacterized protein n=1 Tax=Iris pallida TaxID=29817 RepID=A0AAX6HC87_IRIPA|nr:uncharacterized protein M6B38_322190 [Iris pallida]